MDKISFDFERNEVSYDNGKQSAVLYIENLKEKKSAILAAAGLEEIPVSELRDELNELFKEIGIDVVCAGTEE